MKLFVKDGIKVKQGQRLAYLESTANPEEALGLDEVVNKLVKLGSAGDLESIHKVSIPLYFQLGELQKSYQTFQDAYIRSKALLRSGAFEQKKLALQNDLAQLELLRENLQTQLGNYRKDLELTEDDLRMNRKLHEEKVIADVELRRTQSQHLSKNRWLTKPKQRSITTECRKIKNSRSCWSWKRPASNSLMVYFNPLIR